MIVCSEDFSYVRKLLIIIVIIFDVDFIGKCYPRIGYDDGLKILYSRNRVS